MKKNKVIGVILIILVMSLCGCGEKDTQKYEIPLEVFLRGDTDDMTSTVRFRIDMFFLGCINNGIYENAEINSQNIVEIECTSEQVETQKEKCM